MGPPNQKKIFRVFTYLMLLLWDLKTKHRSIQTRQTPPFVLGRQSVSSGTCRPYYERRGLRSTGRETLILTSSTSRDSEWRLRDKLVSNRDHNSLTMPQWLDFKDCGLKCQVKDPFHFFIPRLGTWDPRTKGNQLAIRGHVKLIWIS